MEFTLFKINGLCRIYSGKKAVFSMSNVGPVGQIYVSH